MIVNITIDDSQVKKVFDNVIIKLSNPESLLQNTKTIILEEVQSHINNQENIPGSPDGTKFKFLSERYKQSKKFKNMTRLSDNPLDTANYRGKFILSSASNLSVKSSGNQLIVNSDHPGVFTHEKGLSVNIFGRGVKYKFPQRSAVWLSERALKSIANNIKNELLNAAKP